MTKYICNGRSTSGITCHTLCKCEVDEGVRAPTECLLDERECTWRRDCTEEKKIDIEEMDERTARFRAYISKRLDALDKKDQELERELKNHYHETGFPK